MNEEFWQSRWRENKIAFHEAAPHEFLKRHLQALDLREGDTVFVPLCGKTIDIDWLLSQGLQVVGIEFNQQAIEEVFERLDLVPTLTEIGPLLRYDAGALSIFLGDFFELGSEALGKVHAIYDRGALVALPEQTRNAYAKHITAVTDKAPQLLIAYSYDQLQTAGPPFSVPTPAIEKLYREGYRCTPIDSRLIKGPLAERCSGEENAMVLLAN